MTLSTKTKDTSAHQNSSPSTIDQQPTNIPQTQQTNPFLNSPETNPNNQTQPHHSNPFLATDQSTIDQQSNNPFVIPSSQEQLQTNNSSLESNATKQPTITGNESTPSTVKPANEDENVQKLHQLQLMSNFLQVNSSQLTVYGLMELYKVVKERQLCILFRNNHFSTLFKFENQLYILVTDSSFLNEPNVVW